MTKTIEDVRIAYNDGKYKPKTAYISERPLKDDHVFDRDKSVNWNYEQVVLYNNELQNKIDAYKKEQIALNNIFEDDIVDAIVNESTILNIEQATVIYNYSYSEHHSHMNDVFTKLYDYIELIENVMNKK